MPNAGETRLLRFGEFELDESALELRRGGTILALQQRAAEVLRCLVSRSGQLIRRDDLARDVWADTTVGDDALNRAVYLIRRTLDDDGARPRFVETARGLGYRFIASVEVVEASAHPACGATASPSINRSPFVGRKSLLERFASAVQDASDGQGRLLLLTGESGVGKTRSALELTSIARQKGLVTRWAWCGPNGSQPPCGPWVQVLRGLVRHPHAGACLERDPDGAATIQTILSGGGAALDAWPALFDAISRFLTDLSHEIPLFLVMDDVDDADSASLHLLSFLSHSLIDSRIVVAATCRLVPHPNTHRLEAIIGSLLGQPHFEVSELGCLGRREICELIASASSGPRRDDLVEEIASLSEGLPLFATAMLRSLEQYEFEDEDMDSMRALRGRPRRVLRCALAHRTRDISPSTRERLRLAAQVGRQFEPSVLPPGSDRVNGEPDLKWLDEAVGAGIVEPAESSDRRAVRFRFRYELVREFLMGPIDFRTDGTCDQRVAFDSQTRHLDLKVRSRRTAQCATPPGELRWLGTAARPRAEPT